MSDCRFGVSPVNYPDPDPDCETQLIQLVEELARNTSQGRQTDLILLDFSKAFDRVNHMKLLHKAHQHGVRGNTLSWIKAFLTGRSQTVVNHPVRKTRHMHPLHFVQIAATASYYKHSFFPLAIVQWNRLPHHIPVLSDLDSFRSAERIVSHLMPKATTLVFNCF